ncbi:MAG: DUF3298 domain-containing protein [Thermoleophilaceae bacterium]
MARRHRRLDRESIAADPRCYGEFKTWIRRRLASASSVVVSVLIPDFFMFVCGNGDGEGWQSVTLRVPSGSGVGIRDLFVDPTRGLRALADLVRTRMLRTNRWVRSVAHNDDPYVRRSYLRGFNPTARNYRYFALTIRGLVIGFPTEQVTPPPAGRVRTTVPYSAIRTYLSDLGNALVAGVRSPRR